MKKNANKSVRIREGRKEAIKQTDYSTCVFIYIYVQDKFIHLNLFKTHSTKRKSLTKKKKNHSTILSISTFLIIILLKEYIWGQKVGRFRRMTAGMTEGQRLWKDTGWPKKKKKPSDLNPKINEKLHTYGKTLRSKIMP